MKTFLLIFVSLTLLSVKASADPEVVNDDVKRRISSGYSFAPVVGYDPTYHLLLGGAVFRGEPTLPASNTSLILVGTLKGNFAGQGVFKAWDTTDNFLIVDIGAQNFFDAYYGEGNNTRPSGLSKIDKFKLTVETSVWHRWDRQMSTGLYTEMRYRKENGIDGDPTRRLFGNEFTPIVGVAMLFDKRDHEVDTHSGTYLLAKLDVGPKELSSGNNAQSFLRVQADARAFLPATEWLVLGGQLGVGSAFGDPGYLYRFALGGDKLLRGYETNRLRGSGYYLVQGEARARLIEWMSVVLFSGIGDVADQRFSDLGTPKLTGGLGLRIGLPPDFVAKARLDVGIASDQISFYLSFNEAF